MHRIARVAWLFCLLPALAWSAPADFPRPPELEPAIRFWTQIYSQVGTDGGLLHDRDDLSVVYERLSFDGMTHAQRVAHVRERRAHYEQILRRLASSPQGPLSADERAVLAQWPEDTRRERLNQAAGSIRFQLGQADRFRRGLIRSGAWEPHIRRTLREMGLPQEIAALPHVESSFNPDAYSRAGAAGIWQFTRSTGQRFMRVDAILDERMDPFRATIAAAQLLQHNHSVTGDWALALSAYNHGLAGIRRAADNVGSTDIARIIAEHDGPRWGFASRNFYPAFLAAVDVDFEAHKYFGILEREDPLVTETIELPFYTSVDTILTAFELDQNTLYNLNRALRPPVWDGLKHIPRGYHLRVPAAAERPAAEEMLARIEPEQQFFAQIPDEFHRVQRGDTLSIIAQRYGTSVRELVTLNNLRSAHQIRIGQNLRLPVTGQPTMAATDGGVYTVRRGDTLSGIAQRVGMTTGALAAANGLANTDSIFPGQQLRVDGGAAVEPPPAVTTAEATQPEPEPEAEAVPEPAPQFAEAAPLGSRADALAIETLDATLALLTGSATAVELAAQQNGLAADPADYTVAADDSIEVQAVETLGHYADWLDIRASDLRRINDLPFGTPVAVGERIRLDFSRVEPTVFESRRLQFHENMQARFFRLYDIVDTETLTIRSGDSLWTLAQRSDNVPLWLLRQYNPELDFSRLRPGMTVQAPVVKRHPDADELVAETDEEA